MAGRISANETYDSSERDVMSTDSVWTQDRLKSLCVFYDETASDLSIIMSRLKEKVVRRSMSVLPDVGSKLVEAMCNILTFSLDFNHMTIIGYDVDIFQVERDKMYSTLESFKSQVSDLKWKFKLFGDENYERIFYKWSTAVLEFLNTVHIFIVRWLSEETINNNFIQLFMQFTRACLMIPESGNCCRKSVQILGKDISSIPDVRFPLFSPTDGRSTIEIMTFADVKDKDRLRTEDVAVPTFSVHDTKFIKKFDSTLGQHGAQLLIEAKDSFFGPAVTGMICIGTKVIFTFLEMSKDHRSLLSNKDKDDQENQNLKSTIIYSRPFDFMDAKDRHEILEVFVWLGYVQNSAYMSV